MTNQNTEKQTRERKYDELSVLKRISRELDRMETSPERVRVLRFLLDRECHDQLVGQASEIPSVPDSGLKYG